MRILLAVFGFSLCALTFAQDVNAALKKSLAEKPAPPAAIKQPLRAVEREEEPVRKKASRKKVG